MNERVYLDYKYSLFGDFTLLQNNILKYSESLGSSFKKELSNEILPPNVVSPLYILDSNMLTIRVGRNRLDFVVKQNFEDSAKNLEQILGDVIPYFSSISRIAINATFFINGDTRSLTNSLFESDSLSAHFTKIKEFLRRYNYESFYNGVAFNNILTFGPDEVINKETFAKLNVILFSIDINNVPLSLNDSSQIKFTSSNLFDFFKYMLSNYKLFIKHIKKMCGFGGEDA